jgi:O-methyltransferase
VYGLAKRLPVRLIRRTGYDLVPYHGSLPDCEEATARILRLVAPFTMTSPEAVLALCQNVQYVVRNDLPGAIVECGVWKGGSIMAVALTLLQLGVRDRKLYLYDTFEGMAEPSELDIDVHGQAASRLMANADKRSSSVWAYSPLEQVERAVYDTGYDPAQIVFVKGKVEETLPDAAPSEIALLRLDTDWYESTCHELIHLYPRLVHGGVLIIDDYGHWQGARRAVDEYINENKLRLSLQRIDYTTRIAIKIDV